MGIDKNLKLYNKLWDMANDLRGKMDASEYKNYILGLIFFKFLSDIEEKILNESLIKEQKEVDKIETYSDDIQKSIQNNTIGVIGYYFNPKYFYNNILLTDNQDLIQNLQIAFNAITDSTIGKESNDDLKGLFSDIRLDAFSIGNTDGERALLIKNLMFKINEIEAEINLNEQDALGDIYEFLIGKFASDTGKTAGEFYTPYKVSELIAKLVTINKTQVKTVYDPTCGSGSLLLRVNDEIVNNNNNNDPNKGIKRIYGQESNPTTYNLARMNMFLHNIHYKTFDIKHGDTLFDDKFSEKDKFELIVANPPFGTKWDTSRRNYLQDDRFFEYNVLPPESKGELAFIQHMLYHLDPNNGVMASVCPRSVLSRVYSEKIIRKHIIEHQNSLDAIINLPSNLFFGTTIPAIIWVFKKNRGNENKILFIDSSNEIVKLKNKNIITDEHINKIIKTYKEQIEIEKYSKFVTRKEIEKNDYNLNFSLYVNIHDEVIYRDLEEIKEELKEINLRKKNLLRKILNQEKQLKKVLNEKK